MIKLGKDLKVGDIIKFWVNGERGMKIDELRDYNGAYPKICCAIATLYGIKADGSHAVVETSIETNQTYEVLNGED